MRGPFLPPPLPPLARRAAINARDERMSLAARIGLSESSLTVSCTQHHFHTIAGHSAPFGACHPLMKTTTTTFRSVYKVPTLATAVDGGYKHSRTCARPERKPCDHRKRKKDFREVLKEDWVSGEYGVAVWWSEPEKGKKPEPNVRRLVRGPLVSRDERKIEDDEKMGWIG